MRKLIPLLFICIFMVSLCAGCTKDDAEVPDMQFTAETLAHYDGKGGRSAYIAVDGFVYDVSNHRSWKNGEHHGFSAGQDLTAAFQDEHRAATLRKLPVMGTYTD